MGNPFGGTPIKEKAMTEQQTQTAPTIVFPKQLLLTGHEYTPAAGTDVQATWRRFGWVPTTEAERAKRMEQYNRGNK